MATYNIHLNMIKVQEWKINLSQATLFDLYSKSTSWATEIIHEGLTYYWCARTKVIEEIPVLTDKPDTVYRLTKELAASGLIMYERINGKDCIRLTEKGKSWNSEKNPSKVQNSENYPNELGKKSENNSEKNPTYNTTSKDNSTSNKKYTLTTSKDAQLFETLNNQKEKAPPVPQAPPEYYGLPMQLANLQERYNAWVKHRELSHGTFGLFEQENQLMLFVGFCNRNNLNQYQFFEHCITCAGGGNWKNLNPELANKSFTTKTFGTKGESKVSQNVKTIMEYANRPENQ